MRLVPINWLYRHLARPTLFLRESEAAHDATLRRLHQASHRKGVILALRQLFGSGSLPIDLFGCRFPNPVGLAAGMDKAGVAVPIWHALGFGFIELGGVTRHPQPGNPPPRMFRYPPHQALINRMGFNNPGADTVAQTLAGWRKADIWPPIPVGINLGKSKRTPNAKAVEDYCYSLKALWDYADFFVVNVSSPNTPGLRALQDKAALAAILDGLREVNQANALSRQEAHQRPLLIKVAPDLAESALSEIAALAQEKELDGIVATNTALTRPEARARRAQRFYSHEGGLSGAPLKARSTEVIRFLHKETKGRLPIIGVGGIFNAEDAWEKITAGASLLQLYTGLVYEGPGIAQRIVAGLQKRMRRHGFKALKEAIGTGAE